MAHTTGRNKHSTALEPSTKLNCLILKIRVDSL
ncbi:unnamed protein product, partial [Vitis vinifera]